VLLSGIGFIGGDAVASNPFFQQVAASYTGAQLAGMLAIFFIYFITGFALYASMFAIIGASVDNETDMQQFVLPVTAPLIIGIAMAQNVIQNPNSAVAHWLSIIPFTSPILMIVRFPFGVPLWQLGLSIGCMVVVVFLLSFLAAKIYRFGILNYGKKATIAQLWAWIKA
jgi:ABC-2 type transport system permease protein